MFQQLFFVLVLLVLVGLPCMPSPAMAESPPTPSSSPLPTPSPTPDAVRPRLYGWMQQGYTGNFAHPSDGVNYGVNFNWRANGYLFNQAYLVYDKPLEQAGHGTLGWRVDLLLGNDAPLLNANGLLSGVTGYDSASGFGVEGPSSYRNVERPGIDVPQAYLDLHLPGFITPRGTDVRVGKFYTLLGREVYTARDTDFYSHNWECVAGTPFTNTGVVAAIHASDTWDVYAGVVRGWDVFADNNNGVSFTGSFAYTTPDQRVGWTTSWITGPEAARDNVHFRSLVTSYVTVKLDRANRWIFSGGGLYAQEPKAATDPTSGQPAAAQWYGLTGNLFYDLDPTVRLGLRAEWFRDNDGTRTAIFGRPGYRASFYDVTLGATIRVTPRLRIRPELRFDWSPQARAYDAQTKNSQVTPAFDVIWEL